MWAERGMSLPRLSPETQTAIRARLSPGIRAIASLNNPIDLTGSAVDEDFIVTYNELCELPQFDAVLMLVLDGLGGLFGGKKDEKLIHGILEDVLEAVAV